MCFISRHGIRHLMIFFVVGCEQKLLSAKNFNKKRPLDLYLPESKKKLVEEKDSNSGDDFRVEVNPSLEK